jgi:hypothetical protein
LGLLLLAIAFAPARFERTPRVDTAARALRPVLLTPLLVLFPPCLFALGHTAAFFSKLLAFPVLPWCVWLPVAPTAVLALLTLYRLHFYLAFRKARLDMTHTAQQGQTFSGVFTFPMGHDIIFGLDLSCHVEEGRLLPARYFINSPQLYATPSDTETRLAFHVKIPDFDAPTIEFPGWNLRREWRLRLSFKRFGIRRTLLFLLPVEAPETAPQRLFQKTVTPGQGATEIRVLPSRAAEGLQTVLPAKPNPHITEAQSLLAPLLAQPRTTLVQHNADKFEFRFQPTAANEFFSRVFPVGLVAFFIVPCGVFCGAVFDRNSFLFGLPFFACVAGLWFYVFDLVLRRFITNHVLADCHARGIMCNTSLLNFTVWSRLNDASGNTATIPFHDVHDIVFSRGNCLALATREDRKFPFTLPVCDLAAANALAHFLKGLLTLAPSNPRWKETNPPPPTTNPKILFTKQHGSTPLRFSERVNRKPPKFPNQRFFAP